MWYLLYLEEEQCFFILNDDFAFQWVLELFESWKIYCYDNVMNDGYAVNVIYLWVSNNHQTKLLRQKWKILHSQVNSSVSYQCWNWTKTSAHILANRIQLWLRGGERFFFPLKLGLYLKFVDKFNLSRLFMLMVIVIWIFFSVLMLKLFHRGLALIAKHLEWSI